MNQGDEKRWDQKWTERAGKPYHPNPLLVNNEALLSGGRALDLACGLGQNSIWLAGHGYQVIGVDISGVALGMAISDAKKAGLSDRLLFAQMDLGLWSLPREMFDLICVFRFLKRRLFPEIKAALRSGGVLLYSTRHRGLLNRQPEANRNFLLKSGELGREFSGWEIVHCVEDAENEQLIARKT